MSMRSWTANGYGFSLYHNNAKQIITYLYNRIHNSELGFNHKEQNVISKYYEKLSEPVPVDETEKDYFDEMYDDFSCEVGCAAKMIAACVNHEHNLGYAIEGFEANSDCGTDEHIGFARCYPWEMKDKYTNMTFDDAQQIMFEIADELGIDETPDDFELEYYG